MLVRRAVGPTSAEQMAVGWEHVEQTRVLDLGGEGSCQILIEEPAFGEQIISETLSSVRKSSLASSMSIFLIFVPY